MAQEVAVVVGVGPGLGWALVKRFAAAGMRVAAAARNAEKLRELIERNDASTTPERIHCYACDASEPTDVSALFDALADDLGSPSLVAFNAGAFERASILETTPAAFERCWRVGCFGGFLVGQAAARLMVARGSGTILFTGATASL